MTYRVPQNEDVDGEGKEEYKMANILIAYYSRKGQNYVNGSIKNLVKGNTERVAEFIQQAVGGDLFEIQTVKEYAVDYTQCTEEAKEDLRAKARPELKEYLGSLDSYDTIFLGYPNWWGTMPMACYTFLDNYDLSGKTIIPFCTHEGSGMGGSAREIKKICPEAILKKGLPIHGAEAAESKAEVTTWAKASV